MNNTLIKNFVSGIANEIESSINEDIDFNVLRKYKKILIIRSAKIDFFENLISKLSKKCNINHFYLIGDYEDYNTSYYKKNVIDLYIHQNRIDNQFASFIKEIKEIQKIDVIIYLSYDIFRPSYLNVIKFANEISLDSGADIYAYNVKADTLTYLKEPKLIQYGIETLPLIVDIANYLLEKKHHENK